MVAWLSLFLLWGCFVHPPLRTCALHYVAPTAATQWVVWRQHSRTSQCSAYGPRARTADGTHAAVWFDEPASNAYARGPCSSSCVSAARNSANASLEGRYQSFVSCRYQCSCACRSWCWTRRYACGRSCCRNSKDGWQELVVGWAEIPPLVSRFRCQTRQCIRQVQCVQEDMLCLQDFHVEDRYGETLQKPSMLQERWQRHWWEGLNWKYAKRAKMRTAKSVIINLLSLWTPEYDHVYYIYIYIFAVLRWGKWLRHSMHNIVHIRFVVQDCSHSRSDWFVCRRSAGWAMMKRPHMPKQTPMTRCLVALLVLPPRLPQWCLLESWRSYDHAPRQWALECCSVCGRECAWAEGQSCSEEEIEE